MSLHEKSVIQDAVGYCENENCILSKRVYESSILSIQIEHKSESKQDAKLESDKEATISALRKGNLCANFFMEIELWPGTNCLHIRACLLEVAGGFAEVKESCDYDAWKNSIKKHSGPAALFAVERVSALIDIVETCESYDLLPVISGRFCLYCLV